MKIIKADTKRFSNWELPSMEHGKPTKYGWIVHHPENLNLVDLQILEHLLI